jgi:hypothetical protein
MRKNSTVDPPHLSPLLLTICISRSVYSYKFYVRLQMYSTSNFKGKYQMDNTSSISFSEEPEEFMRLRLLQRTKKMSLHQAVSNINYTGRMGMSLLVDHTTTGNNVAVRTHIFVS